MAPRGSNNIGSVLKLCNAMGVLGGCNGSLFDANSSASYATRVKGQPLFLVDPNSSFDPFTNFMLNKNAWQPAPDWQYGTGAPYYSDYRYRRRPSENMSFGRIFPVREGMQLSVRIELMNLFNRVQIPNPGLEFNSNNATLPQLFDPTTGKTSFGFGRIDAFNATGQRTGQIVMRFTF
jgi:hypothetical protein